VLTVLHSSNRIDEVVFVAASQRCRWGTVWAEIGRALLMNTPVGNERSNFVWGYIYLSLHLLSNSDTAACKSKSRVTDYGLRALLFVLLASAEVNVFAEVNETQV
jgi:hypothetical protein